MSDVRPCLWETSVHLPATSTASASRGGLAVQA
jgi:hypothetical protein